MSLTPISNSNSNSNNSIGNLNSNNNQSSNQSKRNNNRQDLNHLLSFTRPPRIPQFQSSSSSSSVPGSGRRSNNNRKVNQLNPHSTRQRFIHHFRFILNPNKDYTAHFIDPDIHFEWSDILQVIVERDQRGEIPTCTICLSIPSAARMSKCGHITCLACMLHYLELADNGNKFRKCPICFDPIYEKDLKPVLWQSPIPPSFPSTSSSTSPQPLESISLTLIYHPPHTTLSLPLSSTFPSRAVHPLKTPWDFTPNALRFAKFLLGSPDFIKKGLNNDLRELENELREGDRLMRISGNGKGKGKVTEEELGIGYLRRAVEKIKETLERVEGELNTELVRESRGLALRLLEEVVSSVAALKEVEGTVVEGVIVGEIDRGSDGVNLNSTLTNVTSSSASSLSSTALPFSPTTTKLSALSTSPPLPSSLSPSTRPSNDSSTATNPNSTTIKSKSRSQRKKQNQISKLNSTTDDGEGFEFELDEGEEDSNHFFYQATTGQNIFLQPLDLRILKSFYNAGGGSSSNSRALGSNLPRILELKIEGKDYLNFSSSNNTSADSSSKRLKHLSHLPEGISLILLETDLTSLIPPSHLKPYLTQLTNRKLKRSNKLKKEDKEKFKSDQRELELNRPRFEESVNSFIVTNPNGSGENWILPMDAGSGIGGIGGRMSEEDELNLALFQSTSFPLPPSSSSSPSTSTLSPHHSQPPPPRSFASTLNSTSTSSYSRPKTNSYNYDQELEPDYLDQWEKFEDSYNGFSNGGGQGRRAGGGGSSGANSGGGVVGKAIGEGEGGNGGGGKKKKKKFVLNLTMDGRGSG